MIKYIFLLVFPLGLVSCMESQKNSTRNDVVEIRNFEGHELRLSDFIEKVDVYNLESDSFIVGDVGDLCISGSTLFFIDKLTSGLAAYDLGNHSVVRSVNFRGAGPLEYVRPHALCVDNHSLYLLDSSSRKIIRYNHQLEPQEEIRMDFTAFDFMKVEGGFLLCSVLPEPSLDYKKIVYMDMDGKICDSYIHTHQFGMTLGKNFVRRKDGTVFISTPYSNQIYYWDKERLCEYCYTDFGNLNVPQDGGVDDLSFYDSDYIHNNNFFVTSSYVINAFLYDNRMYYHFRENSTGKSYCGLMTDDDSGVPFFPRWQHEDYLIGLCRFDELPEMPKMKTGQDIREGMSVLIFKMKGAM